MKQYLIFIVSICAYILCMPSCTTCQTYTLPVETDSITVKQLASFNTTIPQDTLSEPLSKYFFDQWEECSKQYAKMHTNPVIDSIYQRAFEHYLSDF